MVYSFGYVYVIMHPPTYGGLCTKIYRIYEVYGSILAALKLLGSLSRIDPHIVRRAYTRLYNV